jgi:hypothetical protein
MRRSHAALITSGMTQQFKYHFLWISASWRLLVTVASYSIVTCEGRFSSLTGKTVRARSLPYHDVCMEKLRKIAGRRAGHVFVFGNRYPRHTTPHGPCDTRYQVNNEVHSKSDCDIWMAITIYRFFPECASNVNVKLGQHNNNLDIILFFLNSRLVVPLRIWPPLSYIIRATGRQFNRFRVLTTEYWG